LLDGAPPRAHAAEVLIEISVLEVRAALDLAAIAARLETGEKLEEGRLAGPVRPDDPDALPTPDEEIHSGKQSPSAPLRPETAGIEDDVPGARRRSESERDAIG